MMGGDLPHSLGIAPSILAFRGACLVLDYFNSLISQVASFRGLRQEIWLITPHLIVQFLMQFLVVRETSRLKGLLAMMSSMAGLASIQRSILAFRKATP